MIHYCRDAQGHVVIPHVGGKSLVVAHLSYPSEVCDTPEGASDAELVALLASRDAEAENEDDADGSLKATRIEAKKREIALNLTAKEQKLARRAAVNKELVEGYLLNRAHRLEVRDQSEAMYRVQNQTLAMSERNLALIEKIQEGLGRVAELEKAASQRAATPPPPIDYSPVLNSVVGAIRDIGVSALQRDSRPRPKAEDDATPVKANLADKPASTSPASSAPAAAPAISTASASSVPALPAAGQPSVAELLAETERLRAERDRMEAELAAERKRQLVLAELAAEPPRPADPPPPSNGVQKAVAAHPARSETTPPPVPTVPRNAPCPCGSGRKYKRCCLSKEQPSSATAPRPSAADPGSPKPAPDVKAEPPAPTQRQVKAPSEPARGAPLANSIAAQSSAEPSASTSKAIPAAAPDRAAAVIPKPTPEAKPEPNRPPASAAPTAPDPAPVGEHIQELLVNAMASKMLADPDGPIPTPLVSQVGQLDEVLVAPPKMDPETARKLLKDGTALEAFGAFLFFNPAIRTMLLSRRGK
ncbi:MAG: SEC-C metal-binding domain-containing protein [Polyangia bacterium]